MNYKFLLFFSLVLFFGHVSTTLANETKTNIRNKLMAQIIEKKQLKDVYKYLETLSNRTLSLATPAGERVYLTTFHTKDDKPIAFIEMETVCGNAIFSCPYGKFSLSLEPRYSNSVSVGAWMISNVFVIRLDRSKDERFRSRGFRYQQVEFMLNNKKNITSITLRSGRWEPSSVIWSSVTALIPSKVRVLKPAYFGDEDPYMWGEF